MADQLEEHKLGNAKSKVKKWKHPLNITRREEVVITRARTGHSRLTHYFTSSSKKLNLCVFNAKPIYQSITIIKCPEFTDAPKTPKNTI